MKRSSRICMQMLLMMILAALLAAGCAKKPAPAPAPADQAGTGEIAPGMEEMGAGVTGIDESMVGETGAMEESMGDADAMAATAPALERIYFSFDRYDLSPEAQAILVNNAEYLKANPEANVRIEGYCDERGSDEYNLALGERRALAAKQYLETLGIDGARLSVISYGEEMPLDPSHNEAAYAMNRRAEFKTMP